MSDYFEEIGAWPSGSNLARAYVIGLVLSIAATVAAYALVITHALPSVALFDTIFVLAFAQLIVQLVCFLHLGSAPGERMRTVALLVALVIVSILVAGSLWIMTTLKGRMMPSQEQMTEYMQNQGGGF